MQNQNAQRVALLKIACLGARVERKREAKAMIKVVLLIFTLAGHTFVDETPNMSACVEAGEQAYTLMHRLGERFSYECVISKR